MLKANACFRLDRPVAVTVKIQLILGGCQIE